MHFPAQPPWSPTAVSGVCCHGSLVIYSSNTWQNKQDICYKYSAANTPEGSSLRFVSLIMHKLEDEGHPDFFFLFPHFEEVKADGCVFCGDTKTWIPPQKSASAPPHAGMAARVCFWEDFPGVQEMQPGCFCLTCIRKFNTGLTSNVVFFSHCGWDLEAVY